MNKLPLYAIKKGNKYLAATRPKSEELRLDNYYWTDDLSDRNVIVTNVVTAGEVADEFGGSLTPIRQN